MPLNKYRYLRNLKVSKLVNRSDIDKEISYIDTELPNMLLYSLNTPIVFGRCSVRMPDGTVAIPTEVLHGFVQSRQSNSGMVLWLSHDSFLQDPFQFIHHSTIERYPVLIRPTTNRNSACSNITYFVPTQLLLTLSIYNGPLNANWGANCALL
jgi:hypothetical protein